MKKTFIRLTYKHLIDINSQSHFDKTIFEITWKEFLLKSQAYNPGNKLDTFNEIRKIDGRVNSLHYKTALVTNHIIASLQNINPYVVDYAGNNLRFDDYRYELIESSLTNKRKHQLAIYFVSAEYILQEISGDTLILSKKDALPDVDGMYETFMLKTERNLYISSYKENINVQQLESTHSVS